MIPLQRKNPGLAGLPNAPIDLTPLLDIIFIFLFGVIISNASAALDVQEEAKQEIKDAKTEVVRLEGELAGMREEMFELTAQNEANQNIRDAYEGEVIGKRFRLVTIYCTYDFEDSTKRKLFVDAPELEFAPIEFQTYNMENAFLRLENALSDYISEVRKDEADAKSERTVVMLYINKESILRRDKERIDMIIEGLERTFEDVY